MKDNTNLKKSISFILAALCFVFGVYRMVYGLYFQTETPWYDYLIEMIFLFFIGAMIIRLERTFR